MMNATLRIEDEDFGSHTTRVQVVFEGAILRIVAYEEDICVDDMSGATVEDILNFPMHEWQPGDAYRPELDNAFRRMDEKTIKLGIVEDGGDGPAFGADNETTIILD